MLVGHSPPFVLTTDHIKDIKLKKKKTIEPTTSFWDFRTTNYNTYDARPLTSHCLDSLQWTSFFAAD